MFEQFTQSARRAVTQAQEQARRLHHRHIGTEHLLLALLAEPDRVVAAMLRDTDLTAERVHEEIRRADQAPGRLTDDDAAALRSIGIDLDVIRTKLEEAFGPGALEPPRAGATARRGLFRRRTPVTGPAPGHIPFTPGAKKALELALREAIALKHRHIGAGHILLGLRHEGGGPAAALLDRNGLDLPELRHRLRAASADAA